MLRLKRPDVTPPKSQYGRGWHYVEQDGTPILGGDRGNLLKKVTDYRIANGLSIANLAEEVEDWICRHTGAECAPPRPKTTSEPDRVINMGDVLRFLRFMAAWALSRETVSQEEADRRAEICAGCRFNVHVDARCYGCGGAFAMIQKIIGDRATKFDSLLDHCAVCGCVNRVAVWMPLDVLDNAHGALEYPEDTGARDTAGNAIPCWHRAGGSEEGNTHE